ncbi:TIR domain-containing protein [Enterobacter hormaechei]|uniref:TIR domain-containing protein n=1 Tax=Enterobacter hormaechei TaxID=158836 RepID=UPI0020934BEA|nr:TIR domain-containing protein [Enterobacter hormaechei]MCO6029651.1 TIR domain-containing protein [Enterobacter hormaechei]
MNLEDIFVTEGVPQFTFVRPPNFSELLIDIRRTGKPVIVEGQSGTGKTTAVKQILLEIYPENSPKILSPREPKDLPLIEAISENSGDEVFIIDDFHRLNDESKKRIADLAKVIAERDDRSNLPKLVIIGINNVGSDLIQLVPDVAKRIGIHRIAPGTPTSIMQLIKSGCEHLNIVITPIEEIVGESRGDYWLTQQICRTVCVSVGVDKTQEEQKTIMWDNSVVNQLVVEKLHHNYDPAVKEFCRGRRFRPTNDPYYKLLRAVSEQGNSNVDLNELANSRPDIKGSINNVKDHRLKVLLEQKDMCSRLFYYDTETKSFAIEDPALFYYLKNLNWESLRQRCGFKNEHEDYEFDIAISFAGENRDYAKYIVDKLSELDISVFYDRHYEDNYLGGPWSKYFHEIFAQRSRLVVAILDQHHKDKIWPTFERECFSIRVKQNEVIPVFFDDTIFPGIPTDLVSIRFEHLGNVEQQKDDINQYIIQRITAKLDSL